MAAAAAQLSRPTLGRGAAARVALPAATALDCRLLAMVCRVRLLPLVQVLPLVAGPLRHEL